MLLLKTGLGIFSKEVLTVTAILNANYGFVKSLFAASDIGVVSLQPGLDPRQRGDLVESAPCL